MIDIGSLKEKIDAAQMVLVGVGEEFNGKQFLNQQSSYVRLEAQLKEQEKYLWLLPYLQYYFLKENNELISAIQSLKELLQGKNYFVVTTCMHGLLDGAGFREDRLVSPCGGFAKLQCESSGCNYLCAAPDTLYGQIEEWIHGEREVGKVDAGSCPECGAPLQFNSLYTENYKEAGYLDMWQTYTRWLQGTLNNQVCVLELGVSLDFPSVIRFPFEKIAFFNQKASFIRIHEKLYQLSADLGGKGISVAENAVKFLNSLEKV